MMKDRRYGNRDKKHRNPKSISSSDDGQITAWRTYQKTYPDTWDNRCQSWKMKACSKPYAGLQNCDRRQDDEWHYYQYDLKKIKIMKRIFYLLSVLVFGAMNLLSFTFAEWDDCSDGIKLNTDVPFVGNCIWKDDTSQSTDSTTIWNAFPKLMWWLSKIIITFVLIAGFLMILVWWVMITAWWVDQWLVSKWKQLIMKVVIAIALLGLSGMILHIINPNFFKV